MLHIHLMFAFISNVNVVRRNEVSVHGAIVKFWPMPLREFQFEMEMEKATSPRRNPCEHTTQSTPAPEHPQCLQ